MQEPLPIRKRYYNPALDIDYIKHLDAGEIKKMYDKEASEYRESGPMLEAPSPEKVNLVSSLCEDGMHRPALDIDVPCVLIPSSTPGHNHLYFPGTVLTWEKYVRLLMALAECGIIEQGYLAISMKRGATHLRPPWVHKISERDALDAANEERHKNIAEATEALRYVEPDKANEVFEAKMAALRQDVIAASKKTNWGKYSAVSY